MGSKSVCTACAVFYAPTVRQLIGEWVRPFSPSRLCWGVHDRR